MIPGYNSVELIASLIVVYLKIGEMLVMIDVYKRQIVPTVVFLITTLGTITGIDCLLYTSMYFLDK